MAVHREIHKPIDLNDVGKKALVVAGLKTGQLSALPLFSQNKRTVAKDLASSVQRGLLDEWLQSDNGQEWFARRRAMWQPDRATAQEADDAVG